jgi:subtilase family serine protease
MNPQVCQKEGEMRSAMILRKTQQAPYRSSFVHMLLLLCLVPLGNAQNMVNAPVDPANRIALKNHQPAWANAQNDQGAVPADLKLEALTIVLNRPPKVEAAYTKFLADQQNPNSPNYHHWLTPVETGQRFGAAAHDIAAVSGWLQAQGLTVDSVSNSKVRITFSGTAATVANAFGGEMHYFQVGEEKRVSLTSAPQIPAALSAVIRVVSGLATVHVYPQHHMSSDISLSPDGSFTCGGVPCYFILPGDFSTIYNVKGVTGGINGAGQTIAIIGRSQVCASDITGFDGIAAVTINGPKLVVPTTGNPPAAAVCTGNTSGDQQEATLDVTRSGSVAQGAAIKLVASGGTATADGVDVATQYVVDTASLGATVMSISFGGCEANFGQLGVSFYDNLFQQAAGEGISVFVSAGDSGAAGCDASFQTPPAIQSLSPNAICASSYATCVGGTEFADTASPSQYWGSNGTGFSSALSYIPEGAWNEPGTASPFIVAGTGGGVSGFIATPTWQTGTGVPSARTGRYTPDVAFSASGHDGYLACLAANGACSITPTAITGVVIFSGTSAAAPDMAGIAALLNQSQGSAQGSLNPNLYTLAATPTNGVFNDVTVASSAVSGCAVTTPSMCNNSTPALTTGINPGFSGYLVGTGYDEATGLGSINVANLLANWGPTGTTPSQTMVQTSAATVPLGTSVTFTVTVAPTSGTGTPTGRVTFLDGTATLASVPLSNGTATYSSSLLAAGVHSITAAYGGDSTFAKSTSSALSQAVVNVTVTESAMTLAVSSGSSGTLTFTVTPTPGTGFAPSVQMTCTVSPALAGCALSPASFTANGATTSTLTITAVKPGTMQRMVTPGIFLLAATFLPLGGFVMLSRKRSGKRWAGMVLILTLSMFTLWLAGCGGGSNNNTPKGSYTVTVNATATAGAITITPKPVSLSLTVQ